MRRSLTNFPALSIGRTSTTSSFLSSFSTSSSGGDGDGLGRGRGRGLPVDFSRIGGDQSQPDPVQPPPPLTSYARGRGGDGRGGVSPPLPPAFPPRSGIDARVSPPLTQSSGRGFGGVSPVPPSSGRGRGGISPPHQAAFSPRNEIDSEGVSSPPLPSRKPIELSEKPMKGTEETKLPSGVLSALSGAGRGTPMKRSPVVSEAVSVDDTKQKQENRHIRKQVRGEAVRGESGRGEAVRVDASPKGPKLSRADAVEKAKGILSKGDDVSVDRAGGRGGGGGRGTRGRGRGRGRGGRGRGDRFEDDEGDDVDYEINDVQDKANEEMLAKRLGPEMMNTVVEAFEEIADRVLPSPVDDAYINALHTNLMIECEPEYMMGEFDQNPDIDEKPPMALRDFLEKVKPFIMSYEGIQSQEEWEEAMKETMENVPLMKEIVDYYSGPARVTAKRQQEELERVAKTLPVSAPSSVKRFTDRAVLSLQSNPGWGFDKKCQFMDKLVWEASQQYK